jgi:hypothetical protein
VKSLKWHARTAFAGLFLRAIRLPRIDSIWASMLAIRSVCVQYISGWSYWIREVHIRFRSSSDSSSSIITGVPKGWQMLPFLVEQSLQIDPSLIDRRTREIEYEAVPHHEFEVFEELGGVRVLSSVELLPHCRHVHRLFDNLVICRDIKFNCICGLTYVGFERTA